MDKIAVVTGGSGGIGRAVAMRFLDVGYCVLAADRAGEALERTKTELTAEYGERISVCGIDVTNEHETEAAAACVEKKFGGCGVIVNCAGAFVDGMIHTSKESDFELMFNVNVKGTYHMMRYFIPLMLKNNSGAVVNISSLSGMGGDYNAPLYSASKAAVIGLSRAAAMDYAELGVRVNVVSPCATKTPMFLNGSSQAVIDSFINAIPDHKLGLPGQVADAICFLCSEQAAHITGQNLAVDGGLSAWSGQPRQEKE